MCTFTKKEDEQFRQFLYIIHLGTKDLGNEAKESGGQQNIWDMSASCIS